MYFSIPMKLARWLGALPVPLDAKGIPQPPPGPRRPRLLIMTNDTSQWFYWDVQEGATSQT